ncbi:unnamed protein product [Hymenolepis diminuta]|uniref:Uncharacterized protein n=1 Tax=Hymenolepis diminuta TaxID=6216 RepID=A0A564Y376_HYMDI|nr:unnamed protein product [Hymenolepis diminuta]
MLFRKFNKSDPDLYLAYLLPLSSKDLTFEETIQKFEKEGEDIHKHTDIGLCPVCYAQIRLKSLTVMDLRPDVMLHNLVDKYNNVRSLITNSNMVESKETPTFLTKKHDIDRKIDR